MNSESQDDKKRFVEEFGNIIELQGMPRMAGRVMGWLLISGQPYQTTSDLMEALKASKASISTATRLLIRLGLIERLSLLGERQDYFRIKPGALHHQLKEGLVQTTIFRQLAERGLKLIKPDDNVNRQWLEEARSMYVFFEREFPVLLERWEQERKRLSSQ